MKIAGLVLAGGRSSRFGSEKAMAMLEGRPLLDHAITYLRESCEALAVNAPPNSLAADHAARLGLTVLQDRPSDPKGPLAGLKAGLHWAKGLQADFLLLTPCDTPNVPAPFAAALAARMRTAAIRTASGLQPLHSIWAVEPALDALAASFEARRHPAVHDLLALLEADYVFCEPDAAFSNVNRADDLALLTASASMSTSTHNL